MNVLKGYLQQPILSFGLVLAMLVAGCGGSDQGREPILGLPAAELVALAVTPVSASVAQGLSQQFVATATYADRSTQDVSATAQWSSAAPATASVNAASGLALGLAGGSAAISANFGGKSAAATLTVLPPALLSLALAPANPAIAIGAAQQFTVLGKYSDGSSRDLGANASFASASPLVASIGAANGLAVGLTAGASVVSVSAGGLAASTTLTVNSAALLSIALTPQNPVLQLGATRQLAVTASYADGSSADVSNASVFSAANPAVASSSAGGLVAGVAVGSGQVSASFGGQSASTTVTVANVTLSSIAVTPATASVVVGAGQQFVATATYSDNSTAIISNTAVWSSNAPLVGSVNGSGTASGVAVGSATISASAAGKSGSALLTVGATPPPPATSLNLGRAASFAVLAGTSITNNSGGTTLVSGDVGSPSQTVDPTQAAGYTNYKSGAILSGALADLQVAISDANGRTCDVSFAGGIDLGGLTLPPGVYCYAGAINITGTLTLNGPGVYIFRSALTLDATANAIVALNNGATAADVNWLPVGPTTLGANAVFKGNVLGQAAAITVGDNTTLLNGRVLSAAAVTLRNNQIAK
ncbi:ice-binding family protein [Rugamonas rubra]|uniref:Ig-like domain (Group 2) n=1 Tax=Rugamonas rubra TaxID=758825 RepID=A0A1I4QI15_9BURK|nr:ice-binding family protein [Rugamonas rubra]SFM39762.1 Ig-like domain (group 2) [Rugamonas rubra]